MSNITLEDEKQKRLVRNELYHSGTSFPEQFLYRSLLQIFPEAKNRFIDPTINMEYDIYIKELNLYIEYNGAVYHTGERKLIRDNYKKTFCERTKKYFVRVLEDDTLKNEEINRDINGSIIEYRTYITGYIPNMISNCITILEDILRLFSLELYSIDYIRSFYEAMMMSSKFQYKIIYNDCNEAIGKENSSQVFCILDELDKTEFSNTRKRLTIKKVVDTQGKDTLIKNEIDTLSAIMFNGNSLDNTDLKPIISLQDRERDINEKECRIEKIEREANESRDRAIKKEKELIKKEELLLEKEETLNKWQQILNSEITRTFNRDVNYRESIKSDIKEREEELKREIKDFRKMKEKYKRDIRTNYKEKVKELEEIYIKKHKNLDKEYEEKRKIIYRYNEEFIEEEVKQRTADIERVNREQVELLKEQLSQQKIESARQQLQVKLGL